MISKGLAERNWIFSQCLSYQNAAKHHHPQMWNLFFFLKWNV